MATIRHTRTKAKQDGASASASRPRNRASAGKDVVCAFGIAIDQMLHVKHAAGLPYSTLNARGEVVFVHPDGTVRTGRDSDSPAAS
jgi:hypothetical protein